MKKLSKKKIILDVDTGIDDSLAIAYTLANPDADLIGVTSEYGNVDVKLAAKNSLKILELLNHPEIPVFIGEPHSSTTDSFTVLPESQRIHGVNGIGEINLPEPKRQPEEISAAAFMINAARQYGKDLTIVPTGPMTNLALALEMEPKLEHMINVTFMGGALTVPGNINPVAEANIYQDPEAANKVFHSRLPLTMVGLDVTHRAVLTHEDTAVWRMIGTPAATNFADMLDYYIDIYLENQPFVQGCALHDPLAAAVAIDPSFVQMIDLDLKVDLEEPYRARTIGDRDRLHDKPHTKVAVNLDFPYFIGIFMKYLGNLFAETKEK